MRVHALRSSQAARLARTDRSWSDRGWPVLAGVTVAIGVVGNVATFSAFGTAMIAVETWTVLALALYCVEAGSDRGLRWSLRGASWCTLAVLSVVGVLNLAPLAGCCLVGAVALTSPLVTTRATRVRRRVSARRHPPPRLDQAAVDRAFAEITARLTDDP